MSAAGYLAPAPGSIGADELARADRERLGFVMNATKLWSHLPEAKQALFDLLEVAAAGAAMSYRQRAVLVTAAATGLRDPYCSLAWGSRLAAEAGVEVATGVLDGCTHGLDDEDRALADWARRVAADPTATTARDVERLRRAGFDDGQIFAITAFVALRVAFAMVNDSLGATPDPELVDRAPAEVVRSVLHSGNLASMVSVLPARVDWLEALVEGDDVFTERFGIPVVEGWVGFPEALPTTLDATRRSGEGPWGTHLFFDDHDGALVGFGGFFGEPEAGEVELGYAVAPERQGRGIATAVVEELLLRARSAGVAVVVAHTLPEHNPSTAVLRKCGFSCTGPEETPEGAVWRWERPL